MEIRSWKSHTGNWKLPLAFFILAFLIYGNTLRFNKYVYDDVSRISENKYVQKGISGFYEIITHPSMSSFVKGELEDYRPVVTLSFALEKSMFGSSPRINHFFNVFFYALLCAFVFVFLRKLFGSDEGRGTKDVRCPSSLFLPIAMAALFTLHPIHTEVVANIKSRDEIFSMLFGILSLILILDYSRKKKAIFLILSCTAFFFCPISKESGHAFLALIPLTLYFFTGKTIRQIIFTTLPFAISAAFLFFIRMLVINAVLISNISGNYVLNSLMATNNAADQLATNFTMLIAALRLLIFPLNLSYDYSYNYFPIVNWSNPMAVFSLLIYLALLIVAVRGVMKARNPKPETRNPKLISYAILFYFITYLITSNLVVKIAYSFGERFLFTPSLGFCIAFPLLLIRSWEFVVARRKRVVPSFYQLRTINYQLGFILLILLLFAIRTIARNEVWKDNFTLYKSGMQSAPESFQTHINYAYALREIAKTSDELQKKWYAEKAIRECETALTIVNNDSLMAFTYCDMGVIYIISWNLSEAAKMYEKAIQLEPKYQDALINYGLLMERTQNFTKALEVYNKLLEIGPLKNNRIDSAPYYDWMKQRIVEMNLKIAQVK